MQDVAVPSEVPLPLSPIAQAAMEEGSQSTQKLDLTDDIVEEGTPALLEAALSEIEEDEEVQEDVLERALSEVDEDEEPQMHFLETSLSEVDEGEEELQLQQTFTPPPPQPSPQKAILEEAFSEADIGADEMQIRQTLTPPPPPPYPPKVVLGETVSGAAEEEEEVQVQQQTFVPPPPPPPPTPPPKPVLSDNVVEKEFQVEDLQVHHNVTPPPPPPPRDTNNGESNYHELSAMMETVSPSEVSEEPTLEGELIPSPESLEREPFSSLASQVPEQPSESRFDNDEKKEPEKLGEIPMVRTPSNAKPPKQPTPKSAEYGSQLESFQMAMLENIEKEASMIRRSGSFSYHQNNLRKEDGNLMEPTFGNDNQNMSGTPRRKNNRRDGNSSSHSRINDVAHDTDVGSLLKETMNDISVAAASGLQSLKLVLQQHKKDQSSENKGIKVGTTVLPVPTACGKIDDSATAFGMEDDGSNLVYSCADPKVLALQRGNSKTDVPNNNAGAELMQKMHDGFRKMMVDATNAAKNAQGGSENSKNNDSAQAWGVGNLLANRFGFEGDDHSEADIASQGTYDTWDDENSVLRRLGSWGTINSQYTAATAATAGTYGTCDDDSINDSVSAAVAQANATKNALVGPDGLPQGNGVPAPVSPLRDDDGNIIDPSLAALSKKKQKRKSRRKKKVRWDYPHVKSLRQYEPPAKEDLPNLFFTEAELDQIEDDRYSTMCSDDIEIVAVASAEDNALEAKVAAKKKKKAENEKGFKSTKGRSSTPKGHRSSGENHMPPKNKESRSDHGEYGDDSEEARSSPRRLVKGVQIYLRERSTGT